VGNESGFTTMTITKLASTTILEGLDLPVLRTRLTLRLLDATMLPPYKGALLRGGFGYAFQRAACPQPCWGHSDTCAVGALCPYRWIFETPHPPDVAQLHDLQDLPRPFVIEPPLDHKRQYAAGDALEFGLVLIGRAIDHLPYFLFSFEQLGRMGLGREQARARLERVEALRPWAPTGVAVYQDGRVTTDAALLTDADATYLYSAATIAARAAQLPADLRITLHTPLRVKARGAFIETFDFGAIIQAACWRLNALATFHGGGPWDVNHRALADQARSVTVEQSRVEWVDWERTSTRAPQPRSMKLGGIIGGAVLRDVPPELRAVLLAGSLVHVGKAAVFGHGGYAVEGVPGDKVTR
jgi:CRISPR-associated endoribonuclease Cas6